MQEAIRRYIAIRPFDHVPDTGGADDAGRLSVIRNDLVGSARALGRVGLEFSAGLAEIPSDPARGGFVTLPEFNALVIEPPAGTPEDEVREALSDDYVLVPNFTLSLPEAALGQAVDAAEVEPAASVLPAGSGVPESHDEGNRGAGVVVAILDTGCDAGHSEFTGRKIAFGSVPPDLKQPIRRVLGFDAGTHGTHVTGIVGGAVVGVAPGAELINASVMESDTLTTTALRVMKALYWLVELLKDERYKDKPVILNLSLGFDPKAIPDDEKEHLGETLRAMRLLMQQLVVSRRILPVVAIGNSGPDTACAPGFFPECLAVGAVDYENGSWAKSSGGLGSPGFEQECNPDICGYGVDVVSGVPRDPEGDSMYERKSGTSMATPYVSGIAALVAAKTGLQGLDLRTHLIDHALDIGLDAERGGKGLVRYDV